MKFAASSLLAVGAIACFVCMLSTASTAQVKTAGIPCDAQASKMVRVNLPPITIDIDDIPARVEVLEQTVSGLKGCSCDPSKLEALEKRVDALEKKCNCGPAVETPLSKNVANTPQLFEEFTIECDGGTCRYVPVETTTTSSPAAPVFYSTPATSSGSVICRDGTCRQTTRTTTVTRNRRGGLLGFGFFGRRR